MSLEQIKAMSTLERKSRGINRKGEPRKSVLQQTSAGQPVNKRKDRQLSAALRQADRAKRTAQQQLEQLDAIFGVGNGAKRERARLAKLVAAQQPKATAPAQKKTGDNAQLPQDTKKQKAKKK